MNGQIKRCNHCKSDKPLEAFHKSSTHKTGRQSFCTLCKSKHGRSLKQKTKRAQYDKTPKGKETHKRACRKYNISPKGRAAYRRYEQSDKGRAMNLHHCRLRKLRCTNAINDPAALKEFYFELRTRKEITCFWCDKLIPKHERHGDHVQPLSKGGMHCISNLVPACAYCNISRGNYYA